MNLSQKRTCKGCKALSHFESFSIGYCVGIDKTVKCKLGFGVVNKAGIPSFPYEPCYKPLTQKQLEEARRMVYGVD